MFKSLALFIINLILKTIDFNQKKINKLIATEIQTGGSFEKLLFPIEELNEIHVIQFFKLHPTFGQVSGLGADSKIEMAYLKAIVEYFERLAFFENEKKLNLYSTNGIAAHRIKNIAKKSAQDELLERDAFLRHWYSNTPFIGLELNTHEKGIDLLLKKESLELILAESYLGSIETIVCFLKDNKSKGFALGLSAGRGICNREKAIQEAIINYFFGHQGFSVEEQLATIKSEGIHSLLSHRAYWLYIESIPEWLIKGETKDKLIEGGAISHFKYEILEEVPFKVYRCINHDLIDLTVGDVCKNYPEALTKIGLDVVLGPTQYHPIP